MWKHKTKWLVRGGRKVKCYLCGKKILTKGDLFLFHQDTGYYSHQSCQAESTTISGNERRRAVKKIAVGAAVVGAIAAGAGKFLDVSSQSKNSPAAQTILTSQGLIPPALTSDPANPVPGQMWYRSDAGVEAHFDGVQNRVVYSSEINDGNVNVTSKGIVNGLSVLPNDGKGGFGPDTTLGATAPGQYGGTYTETTGVQELIDYAVSRNGNVVMKFMPGIYLISSSFKEVAGQSGYPTSNIYAQIMLPNSQISLVFEGVDMPNWWEGSGNGTVLESAVILYSTQSTTSTNRDHFVMAVPPGDTTQSLGISQLFLTFNGIMFQVNNDANVGGLEAYYAAALYGSFIGVSLPYYLGQASVPSAVYGICLPTESSSSTVHIGTIFVSGMFFGVLMTGGHYHIDKLVITWCSIGITLYGSDGYDNFIGMYDLQVAQYGINCNTGTNFHLVIGLWTWGDEPTSVASAFAFQGWVIDYGGSSSLVIQAHINASSSNTPIGVSSVTGSGSYVNLIPIARNTATPTLSANPPVSGTVYRNLNTYDIEIDLPVYATTAGTAGYVTIAKGATSTPTAIGNQFVSGSTSSTSTDIIKLRVPAGWYYEFTESGVTFGTASVFAV